MYIDIITNCFYSILSGLIIYFILIGIKQNWVNTIYYLITFMLLPPVAFVITNVISNNLALSLGMIGALSIVRFRNPVKSALELVMFFVLITIGISAGVKIKYSILLVTVSVFIIILIKLGHYISKKVIKKSLYNVSFNDGIELNTIEIFSTSEIENLENNKNIKNIIYLKEEKTIIYRLAFENEKELNFLKEEIKLNKEITKVDINYV